MMSDETFTVTKPEGMSYASWMSLCDALELYIADWDDYQDDGE